MHTFYSMSSSYSLTNNKIFVILLLLILSCMCQENMAQIYGTCQPGYAISSGTFPVDSGTCESKVTSLQECITAASYYQLVDISTAGYSDSGSWSYVPPKKKNCN